MNEPQPDQGAIRAEVLQLISRKDQIEVEMRELAAILSQQNGVGMHEPLVDAEGFPKNSIDTYQVRHARHQIICLQNDHKALMKQIERGLQGYYSASSSDCGMDTQPIRPAARQEFPSFTVAFARVTDVTQDSPADLAGIQAGDQVVEFGSVNSMNFKAITDIATVVQHSEGTQISLKLKRNERFITISLVPKRWAGRGLLGCNIVSI
ncbi:hypothetical protein HUJ04_013398 [Dendroctonus ponderosae]